MSFSKNSSKAFSSLLSDFRNENTGKKVDSTSPDISKPTTKLDSFAKELVGIFPKAEKQTIIHCKIRHTSYLLPKIRIWRSTFLRPKGSYQDCKLIGAYNIAYYPDWTLMKPQSTHHFTLIFEGLPSECRSFDLEEDIIEEGGFFVSNISRNESDIYHVEF
jgi:hypothetical protein